MTSRLLLSFPKWVAALAVSFGVFISMAPRADAQCFTPDGLDSAGCCSAATPNRIRGIDFPRPHSAVRNTLGLHVV